MSKNRKTYLSYLLYIIAITISINYLIIPYCKADNNKININDPNKINSTNQEQQADIERQIISAATLGFTSSLEMKENVDFILTPALLVQEVISNNLINTYPSE